MEITVLYDSKLPSSDKNAINTVGKTVVFPRKNDSVNIVNLIRHRELGSHRPHSKIMKNLELKSATAGYKVKKCKLPPTVRSAFLVVFSPDKTLMASTHGDHKIYIFEVDTRKIVHVLSGHTRTPWCVTFHPQKNNLLASGCLGGEVRIWDLAVIDMFGTISCKTWRSNENTTIASVSFHPVMDILAIATTNLLFFWEWKDMLQGPWSITNESRKEDKIRFVKFNSLGTRLITGINRVKESSKADTATTSRGSNNSAQTTGLKRHKKQVNFRNGQANISQHIMQTSRTQNQRQRHTSIQTNLPQRASTQTDIQHTGYLQFRTQASTSRDGNMQSINPLEENNIEAVLSAFPKSKVKRKVLSDSDKEREDTDTEREDSPARQQSRGRVEKIKLIRQSGSPELSSGNAGYSAGSSLQPSFLDIEIKRELFSDSDDQIWNSFSAGSSLQPALPDIEIQSGLSSYLDDQIGNSFSAGTSLQPAFPDIEIKHELFSDTDDQIGNSFTSIQTYSNGNQIERIKIHTSGSQGTSSLPISLPSDTDNECEESITRTQPGSKIEKIRLIRQSSCPSSVDGTSQDWVVDTSSTSTKIKGNASEELESSEDKVERKQHQKKHKYSEDSQHPLLPDTCQSSSLPKIPKILHSKDRPMNSECVDEKHMQLKNENLNMKNLSKASGSLLKSSQGVEAKSTTSYPDPVLSDKPAIPRRESEDSFESSVDSDGYTADKKWKLRRDRPPSVSQSKQNDRKACKSQTGSSSKIPEASYRVKRKTTDYKNQSSTDENHFTIGNYASGSTTAHSLSRINQISSYLSNHSSISSFQRADLSSQHAMPPFRRRGQLSGNRILLSARRRSLLGLTSSSQHSTTHSLQDFGYAPGSPRSVEQRMDRILQAINDLSDSLRNYMPLFIEPYSANGVFTKFVIQSWKFKTVFDRIPLKDKKLGVVAKNCLIRNDASVSISKDEEKLAVIYFANGDKDRPTLGVFSLNENSLGQQLCQLDGDFLRIVSVSFSPMDNFIALGFGRKILNVGLFHIAHEEIQMAGYIISLTKSKNGELQAKVHKNIEFNQDSFSTLNSLQWIPKPGHGFVFASSNGAVGICEPHFLEKNAIDVQEMHQPCITID